MSTHSDEAKATKTLLTALRILQVERKRNPAGVGFDDNLFNDLLDDNEIDELCEAIGVGFEIKHNDTSANYSVDESDDESENDYEERCITALRAIRFLKDHYSNPDNQSVAKLEIENNDGDYTDFYFRFDSEISLDDERNKDVYVQIACTINWLEKRLYCEASLNSEDHGSECSLPVPLAIQNEVSDACKKLIAEQHQILSDEGISLSSVNNIPIWTSPGLLEQPKSVTEKIYDLLHDYHSEDLTRDSSEPIDSILRFHNCTIEKDDDRKSVFVSIRQNLVSTLQDENNAELVVYINYKIGSDLQNGIDDLVFGYAAKLRHKDQSMICDLPIPEKFQRVPLKIQKEIREIGDLLGVSLKYFLSINGIKLVSIDNKPAWERPDLLEPTPYKADSGYEEWSQVLADMANEVSHEVDEDDGCSPS